MGKTPLKTRRQPSRMARFCCKCIAHVNLHARTGLQKPTRMTHLAQNRFDVAAVASHLLFGCRASHPSVVASVERFVHVLQTHDGEFHARKGKAATSLLSRLHRTLRTAVDCARWTSSLASESTSSTPATPRPDALLSSDVHLK
jgi:hypothetical protein